MPNAKKPGVEIPCRLSGVKKYRHYLRPKETWYVVPYEDAKGNWTGKRCETEEEAKAFKLEVDQLAYDRSYGRRYLPANKTPRFGEYMASVYLPRHMGEPATLRSHKGALARIRRVAPHFEQLRIGQISGSDIELVMTTLAATPKLKGTGTYSPAAVNDTRRTIAAVLNYATRKHKIMPHNNAADAAKVDQDSSAPPPPEVDEFLAILDALNPRMRQVVYLLAATGMRSSELRGVRVTDIVGLRHKLGEGWYPDPDGRWAIRLSDQLDFENRTRKRLKTKRSRRTIPLDLTAIAAVCKQLNDYGPGPDDLAFRGFGPTGMLSQAVLRNHVHTASMKVLGRDLTAHDMRHFNASLAIDAGVSVVELSRRLGHATTQSTEGLYYHLIQARDRAVADAIGSRLAAGQATSPPLPGAGLSQIRPQAADQGE